ncbi:MAG: hypothetical protein CBC35_09345 [Planctomycetes bacterium TMED75]|nr:hypothetical protein [Planctomycetaceae bacterium]OUU91554.1 MAG: hypothetical protein CBC35_09345 [Planctomycetes bacterium TMED75]
MSNDLKLETDLPSEPGFLDFIGSSMSADDSVTATGLLNAYVPVFVVAFLVTLLVTPIIRSIAVQGGVVDTPDGDRKLHKFPIAYLGGLAVLGGICSGLIYSYLVVPNVPPSYSLVPLGIILGMFAICFTGFMDDVWHWDPRLKIAGQLVAAAGLTLSGIGVNVAKGMLLPILGPPDTVLMEFAGIVIESGGVYYWIGTIITAFFVIGGCNATNLIDGLDGLLSGTAAIMAIGFLVISIIMAVGVGEGTEPAGVYYGARITLSFALLGAVLGFLPFNFNPAVIFLGDCGSLLIGYMCVVIILLFGEMGETHLVVAGLIVFTLPIMDTLLAIIRRKLSGLPMSAPDSGHIHHMLLRALRSVKATVFALYGLSGIFMLLGIALALLYTYKVVQGRVVYGVFLVLFSFISAVAIKAARRGQWERRQISSSDSQDSSSPDSPLAAHDPDTGSGAPGDDADSDRATA